MTLRRLGSWMSAWLLMTIVAPFPVWSQDNGAFKWSKRFGGGYQDTSNDLAVDAQGNIAIAGEFAGDADFGGGPLPWVPGNFGAFVAKYSPDGAHVWSRSFGNTWENEVSGVAFDHDGNVLIVGSFEDTVDFGGGPVSSPGIRRGYLVKYAGSNGAIMWAKSLGGDGNTTNIAAKVTVDPSGNILVIGGFWGGTNIQGTTLTSVGGWDVYVAKFSSAGSLQWVDGFGGTGDVDPSSIKSDSQGNVLVAGTFVGTVTLGSNTFSSASGNSRDLFVAKLSASGAVSWSKQVGAHAEYLSASLAVDSGDNTFITSWYHGPTDFGGTTLDGNGGYLAKYNTAGSLQWVKKISAYVASAATDASGNVVITGDFHGTGDFAGGTATFTDSWDHVFGEIQARWNVSLV